MTEKAKIKIRNNSNGVYALIGVIFRWCKQRKCKHDWRDKAFGTMEHDYATTNERRCIKCKKIMFNFKNKLDMKNKTSINGKARYFLYALLAAVAFGCSTSDAKENQLPERQKTRIVIIEQQVKNSKRFSIVSVDGVEFFVTDNATVRLGNYN
jgi:hypothetical protein